jgi:hypothetical protein
MVETGHHGGRLPDIAAQAETSDSGVAGDGPDLIPGIIPAAIIHQDDLKRSSERLQGLEYPLD